MNAIGIDYQQTLSVICLREGQGAAAFRNVGDGLRQLIPNVVLGENLWGSHALRTAISEGLSQGNLVQEGPWPDERGALTFWRGIAQRLYSYLGQVSPIPENSYQVVVGLYATDFTADAERVEGLCRAASLGKVTCIPASDALLCRWLGEQRPDNASTSLAVAIVVGDTTTLVAAYRFQRGSDRHAPRMVAGRAVRHLPLGHAAWTSKILESVRAHLREPLPAGYELALRDAVIEFVTRLGREKASQAVEWTGFLRERMHAPFALTQQDCASWLEAQRFSQSLPAIICDALASISDSNQPDQVLLGGIGALWPFVMDAAAQVGPVWQSATPVEDVARGATWWPQFQLRFAELILPIGTWSYAEESPREREIQIGVFPGEAGPGAPEAQPALEAQTSEESMHLPPWKRQELADF